MSRQSSNSPDTLLSLPRRAVLKSLAAAPAVTAVATGQAFSFPAPEWRHDERFAKTDHLIGEINTTYAAFLAVQDREGEFNDDGEDIYEAVSEKWQDAKYALQDYAAELLAKRSQDNIDALVLLKIADFQLVDTLDDIDFLDPNLPKTLRAVLQVNGIPPTEETATSIESAKFDAEIASRPPTPERTPSSVNAGNLIADTQNRGQAHDAAIRYEAALEDGTPESNRAMAVRDRQMAELVALRDEIIGGRAKPFNYKVDNPYVLTGLEEFVVFVELISAMCPSFWTDARHGNIGPVLKEMKKAAASWSLHYLEQAERWNAERGGANV